MIIHTTDKILLHSIYNSTATPLSDVLLLFQLHLQGK